MKETEFEDESAEGFKAEGEWEEEDIVLDVSIEEAGYEAGDKRISDVSFQVRRGQLLGLIGPNGAGKSTTIKTLLGLLKYAKAKVIIGGESQSYAYVPEQPVFYEDLTLWEHLDLAAAAYGLSYETLWPPPRSFWCSSVWEMCAMTCLQASPKV